MSSRLRGGSLMLVGALVALDVAACFLGYDSPELGALASTTGHSERSGAAT